MDRRVTIVDVARHAGVSISSVSTALNGRSGVSEATRERIQTAARELGFVASIRGKSLSAKRAFAVGLVVHRDPQILETDPFFSGFISGIESVLSRNGYALVLQMGSDPADSPERYRRLALDRRVDGVFLIDIEVNDKRVPLLADLHMPAVAINSQSPAHLIPAVVQESTAAIQDLVDYLIALGHRRFGHVSGPLRFLHASQRSEAWTSALRARDVSDNMLVESDFTYDGGVAAAERVFRMPRRPTAVFCANDIMAAGFVARMVDLGLSVPRDISVAGFDGTTLGTYVRPSLTTLSTSPRSLGVEAARLLLDQIEAGSAQDVAVDPCALVIRESTGTAPQAR